MCAATPRLPFFYATFFVRWCRKEKKYMSEDQQETLSEVTGDLEIQLWDHRFFWIRIGF
jgi:hypothetical protein